MTTFECLDEKSHPRAEDTILETGETRSHEMMSLPREVTSLVVSLRREFDTSVRRVKAALCCDVLMLPNTAPYPYPHTPMLHFCELYH